MMGFGVTQMSLEAHGVVRPWASCPAALIIHSQVGYHVAVGMGDSNCCELLPFLVEVKGHKGRL
jgi:hypothetical protein